MAATLDLKAKIRDVPDFPTAGIVFKDITPLVADPASFRETSDRLATGGTAKAKVDLVEQLGGIVVGALFVIELTFLHGRDKLAGYDVHALIEY